MSETEVCKNCGHEWGVTTTPRENVLCSACVHAPRLPEGEVRTGPGGVLAVCVGAPWDLRWHVVGVDPHGAHGWRYDHQVADWRVIGNIHNLDRAEALL